MDRSQIAYQVVKSSRRTIAIQINTAGQVIVRCPNRMRPDAVHAFVQSKASWIEAHLEKRKACPQQPAFTDGEIRALARQAKTVISQRVAFFAPLVGVRYGSITIRAQRTRWGSCSSKGNLNFNCLLMLAPPEVLDYVVVHELCHRKEMNHSPGFWAQVEKVLPDYRLRQKWLKENGAALIGRLAG